MLWQQLSCILSADTTGWQPALLNACIDFAVNPTCAESLAHELRSPPSDDSACRCLNAQRSEIAQILKVPIYKVPIFESTKSSPQK